MPTCSHCGRVVSAKALKIESQTIIHNGKKEIYAWVGCVDCWERLQKVA